MLKIKLRAYFSALLLLIFIISIFIKGWLITTIGILSLISIIRFLFAVIVEDPDMNLKEFIFKNKVEEEKDSLF